MLKIWLTWLQPSLGIVGMVLVLASPLYSLAAQKPTVVGRANKTVQPKAIVASDVSTTTGTRVQLAGIAATPDLAVRQLATSATAPISNPSGVPAQTRQQSNRDALDSFLTPSIPSQNSATKSTKPKFAKRSVTSALARTVKPKTTAPVAGFFIGNSDVRVASSFSPNSKQPLQPISSSTEIGAPTPLSTMSRANKAVDPYPVVRPELMQKLGRTPALAKVPAIQQAPQAVKQTPTLAKVPAIQQAPQAVKQIATMPSGMKKAPQALKPSATTPPKLNREVPHSLDPIAKIPSKFHQEVPHSLDPIAAIPSGLQRLLGNDLNSDRPVAPVRVAKANVAKFNSLLALDRWTTPASPEIAKGTSLQLATAQAYTSVPKFDIPGESTVTLTKPETNVVSAKRPQKAAIVASVKPKSNYVALISNRHLEPHTQQSWTLTGQRNNLGGLILGSQSPATTNNRIGFAPLSEVKTTGSNGFSGIHRSPVN